MKSVHDIRPSPIAGQWYLANADQLASQVDHYINAAHLPALDGEVIAVMAPHAGHRYSGAVAGYAFASLKGLKPDIVAVVSPMHYAYPEPLLTTAHEAYATPLGWIPVEQGLMQDLDARLRSRLNFGLVRVANDPEHSLEIELPFLQRALPNEFYLMPIMVRDQRALVAQSLGQALAEILASRSAILVASTDLSHFYPQAIAEVLDSEVLRQVEALDPLGLLQVEEQGKGFACGHGALAAVLWAAIGVGADDARILRYATSGDTTGDYNQVVGYGAAAIMRRKGITG